MGLEQHSVLVILLAGVSFFMFGMTLASKALGKLLANRIRDLLSKISKNHFFTIGIGVLLTIGLQSSGAVTSMLVGLGSAGVIQLTQVMGIVLGSAIGSTITVQLISFNISLFGLPIFVTAFSFYFVTNKKKLKNFISIFMGFGLIFFGLELIGISAKEIQKIEFLANVFTYLSQYPLISFIVSILFTGFVHSSAVTIGFVATLAVHGLISYDDSIYWILGANVGTASTAMMASMGASYIGRQVAWAHLLYRMASALICLALVAPFSQLVLSLPLGHGVSRDIANAHTLFNILAALLFLPLINFGARFIEKLFPPREDEQEFSTNFLQSESYHSTTLAIAYAQRELMRMGDIVLTMIEDSIRLFHFDNPELRKDISERDNQVDLLQHEIKLFLVQYSNEADDAVARKVFKLISFANDLESAADVIDNTLADLARKKQHLKQNFSEQGWKEVCELHEKVVQFAKMSLSSFQTRDGHLAKQLIQLKREIRQLEKDLRESHIQRLNKGLQETINTSSIHLDLLGGYRRIVGLMSNHAYGLAKKYEKEVKAKEKSGDN